MNNRTTAPEPTSATLGALLALTIFTSAFLLFQVQPLISKFILPWFGGSPAVWTTAMLFFQCTLFLGYVYSHLISSRLPLHAQVKTHIVILVIAAAMAYFVIPMDALKPKGTEDPTLKILVLLTLCVGMPYFVLSTTGPLIQAWFSRAYPGRSPYRLFSLSNLGSLLALGSFPFLFEPYFELMTMGRFWMIGFWVFAVLCVMCAVRMLGFTEAKASTSLTPDVNERDTPPTWRERISWIGLSGMASLMFIATTNHVCHDVATVPFLWIVPLALYLLTFIICFDHERWYVRGLWSGICAASIVLLTGYDFFSKVFYSSIKFSSPPTIFKSWFEAKASDNLYHLDIDLGFVTNLILHFGVMFLICLVCHGELVRLKPSSRNRITEYYLLISAGGALGGLFITFVATKFFTEYYEWPLGLIISFLIAAGVWWSICQQKQWFGPVLSKAVGLMVGIGVVFVAWSLDPFDWQADNGSQGVESEVVYRARNFYGTVSVTDRKYTKDLAAEDNDGIARKAGDSYRNFWSGAILHGREWQDDQRRNLPLTYYSKMSGAGRVLTYCQEQSHHDRPMKFAVVGLGAGALASYARPAEGARMADECVTYEINPEVERIARDRFFYLPDYETRLGKKIEVRLGDARLTMEREAPQEFDVIVLDAFSGDSVPAHLLTREAFEIYRRHLKKKPDGSVDGFIVVHITNSFLNLYPVVKNAATQVLNMPFTSIYMEAEGQELVFRTHYFIITNDSEFLKQTPSIPQFITAKDSISGSETLKAVDRDTPGIPLWTDHYSTIFNILLSD